jgi:N6-adenosine-specific RNA methylase IME4
MSAPMTSDCNVDAPALIPVRSSALLDLVGEYSTIVADPPWDVKRGAPQGRPEGVQLASEPLPYPTMSVDEIAALPVKNVASNNAHLYIWTINKYIEDTYRVARAWGFEPSTMLYWLKEPKGIGLGGTYALCVEPILFCRRGTLAAKKRCDRNWWTWPRGGHSVKPPGFQTLVEEYSPGPYLEMFARRKRDGWDVWGNEV